MLETTVIRGNGNRRRKRLIILPLSIGLHIALIAGAVFSAVWRVELPENAPPQIATFQGVIAPPTPPPAPPPPRPGPTAEQRPVQPQQPVAPPEVPETIPEPAAGPGTDSGVDNGSPDGEPGGESGGVVGGTPGGVTLPDAPAPSAPVRVSKPPRILFKVKPEYPRAAWLMKLTGSVLLECVVDRTGAVRDVRVIRSSHHAFEAPAIDALRQWRFEPGSVDGKPVEVIFNLHVNFTLE